jgi:hydroxyacylglutathione hydrolase
MDPLISPEDLYAQLAGPNPPIVIDVRPIERFLAGHIPGALHIPEKQVPDSLNRIPRDRAVVTY